MSAELTELIAVLSDIKPTKIVRIKTDRIMLHVEPIKSGGLRVTYSDGFVKIKGLDK